MDKTSVESFVDEASVPNVIRCPFHEEPISEHQRPQTNKYSKRTQRHRSTAQSRLGDMTVGDIRYCFQQLRNAGGNLNPDMMLYNGETAGEFALKYLRETSTATKKRRKKLSLRTKDMDLQASSSTGESMGTRTQKPPGIGRMMQRNKTIRTQMFFGFDLFQKNTVQQSSTL